MDLNILEKTSITIFDAPTARRAVLRLYPMGPNMRYDIRLYSQEEPKGWNFLVKRPLPINDLCELLQQAYKDVWPDDPGQEGLSDYDFSRKYSKEFFKLEHNQARAATAAEVKKPSSWEEFVALAVEIAIRKNTDYEAAFMAILLDEHSDGRSIWAWEVKKKLDRLRRWIKRGELLVKGEGVLDSVLDLTIYTVQYEISGLPDPYKELDADRLESWFIHLGPKFLMRMLTTGQATGNKPLLDPGKSAIDSKVYDLIEEYWGVK